MATSPLFTTYHLGKLELKNRLVMAPMTRSRAVTHNAPDALMADYYRQRATAGLIVTEGTSPSPNGLGYARIPGLYSAEQIAGWKLVTDAVHQAGGRIFAQLMHCGRIAHVANLPAGAEVVAPSPVAAPTTQMWTDTEGMQSLPVPREMTAADIQQATTEFVQAARNAIEAGFDGVELHGANGYLLEQFLNPASNLRTDEYGGSVENRSRFVLEVAAQTAAAIGKDKVGIRLSPYGVFGDMPHYPEIDQTYRHLAEKLNELGLVYLHLVNHHSMGGPEVPQSIVESIRERFEQTLILSGGYDRVRAETDIERGLGNLVAFGRPFIANPDLVERLQHNLPLAQPDPNTFYTPGPAGYTDYPKIASSTV